MLEKQCAGETPNVLANRWFQPLTHVSEARSPRETAKGRQGGKREKREISGSSWHSPRHSLISVCSRAGTNLYVDPKGFWKCRTCKASYVR